MPSLALYRVQHDDTRHAATSSNRCSPALCLRPTSRAPPRSFLARVDCLQHNPTSPLVKLTHTPHHRFTMRARRCIRPTRTRARSPRHRPPFAVPAEYHHQDRPPVLNEYTRAHCIRQTVSAAPIACSPLRLLDRARTATHRPPLPPTLRILSISLRRSANAVARTLEALCSLLSLQCFAVLAIASARGGVRRCITCSSFSRKFLEHPARLRPDFTESLVSSTQGFSGYRATSAAFSTSQSARLNQTSPGG
ncbi:hypothetical protein B0H13DRAFT_1911915 [Mycena leptocephala]|nr:hypothetical protein B0H13DRAFT_1911915 [Mycena leptocephala]